MSNITISPNMGLIIPTVSNDPGPDWATNLNSSLSILDQHNHSNGSGVQITPAGLNINADLTFNQNNATALRSARFQPQAAPLSGGTDLGCLYEAGVDLYYNDGSGNQIRITQSGSVAGSAGTITGLPSGTASAAFAASTFTFQAATLTPANIDGGSFILRNNVASSKGLTLSPPSAMAANYTLVLPALPASTLFVTLDSSGNLGTTNGIQATQLANQTITQGLLALRTTGSTVAAGGVAISASSGNYAVNTGSTWTTVTNQSVTITTTGRPVMLMVVPDGSTGGAGGNLAMVGASTGGSTNGFSVFGWNRSGTILGQSAFQVDSTDFTQLVAPGCLNFLDVVAAGTYTYTLQSQTSTSTFARAGYIKIVAYEI